MSTTEPLITPEARAAKRRRAELLADAIEHVDGDAEGAAQLGTVGWALVVEVMRYLRPDERVAADYRPGPATVNLVLRMLTDRAELRLPPAAQPDPFRGLQK